MIKTAKIILICIAAFVLSVVVSAAIMISLDSIVDLSDVGRSSGIFSWGLFLIFIGYYYKRPFLYWPAGVLIFFSLL